MDAESDNIGVVCMMRTTNWRIRVGSWTNSPLTRNFFFCFYYGKIKPLYIKAINWFSERKKKTISPFDFVIIFTNLNLIFGMNKMGSFFFQLFFVWHLMERVQVSLKRVYYYVKLSFNYYTHTRTHIYIYVKQGKSSWQFSNVVQTYFFYHMGWI